MLIGIIGGACALVAIIVVAAVLVVNHKTKINLNDYINIKYDGYIKRQMRQVEQFKKLENKRIPENINYDEIQSLRLEAKQKLNQIRPSSIGQASRISGVSPADVSVLLVYLSSK